MKKYVIILLLVLNLLYLFSNISNTFAVTVFVKVEVSPNRAGSGGEYHIYADTNDYLFSSFNRILITFPNDTTSIYADKKEAPSSAVTVNGVTPSSVKVSYDNYELIYDITMPKSFDIGNQLDIKLFKDAGIINPTMPRSCYSLLVELYKGSYKVLSLPSYIYEILISTISNVKVVVNPPLTSSSAEYKISFSLGVNGLLKAKQDYIYLSFPSGFSVKSSFTTNSVLVNGTKPVAVYRSPTKSNTIEIVPSINISPKNIYSDGVVDILLSESFGVINSSTEGYYTTDVYTSNELEPVKSEPFEIIYPSAKNLQIIFSELRAFYNSEILVKFQTSSIGKVAKGKNVFISFPDSFSLPPTIENDNVFVNNLPSNVRVENNTVILESPVNINGGDSVEIKVLQNAGIRNPNLQGEYSITVWTDSDKHKVSLPVNIKPSAISDVKLEAEYSGINTTNTFKVLFNTGPVYTLSKDNDFIKITFDEGFVFPEAVSQNLITVNGNVSTNVSKDVYSIFVTAPIDISPGSRVEVIIPDLFGIKNPPDLGEYGVRVSTTKELEEIESNKISITPLPVVEFTINPQAPDGQNGYYKTAPEIRLSTSNGVKVFFKVDDGEFAEFIAPFKIDEGTHTIYAYAMDDGGNKGDTIKREFNVDNTPPKITFDNANSDPYFKESPGKLTGNVSEPCTLKINEVILELKDDLHFFVELNVYEGMPIAIFARDLAGNAATLLLTAHIDSKPPVITFISKVNRVQGLGVNSVETTEPAYPIQLKIDEKGKVFVNSNEMFFDGQTFSYIVNLVDGDNQFIIKAVDAAGNEAIEALLIKKVNEKKITLQIGSNLATIGSETIELEAAPFIEKRFTLVPLRFIAEAFGATLDYNSALQIINISYKATSISLQVGSTIVFVNNVRKEKDLEIAPVIVNGRTFVPIRFISETFGATVDWDGTTKTVTIVYKP
jgi:hypothetical protein